MQLNPLGLTSGNWSGNYIAPNSPESGSNVNPKANAAVASYAVGNNVLNVPNPVPKYSEPITTKDNPSGIFL